MVESSKILTVSYGTFSCTLEGFDDSFGTMKAIAEYFRDLAERDRYFGAEPPIPDAEMLARIAEREIERRVEARAGDSGIVLRAAPAVTEQVAETSDDIEENIVMPPAAEPPEATPDLAAMTEVADDSTADDDQAGDTAEVEMVEATEEPAEIADEIDTTEDVATDPEPEMVEDDTAEDDIAMEEAPEPQDVAAFFADAETVAPTATVEDTDNEPDPIPSFEEDSVAARLRRIRAVVSNRTDDSADIETEEEEIEAAEQGIETAFEDLIEDQADEDAAAVEVAMTEEEVVSTEDETAEDAFDTFEDDAAAFEMPEMASGNDVDDEDEAAELEDQADAINIADVIAEAADQDAASGTEATEVPAEPETAETDETDQQISEVLANLSKDADAFVEEEEEPAPSLRARILRVAKRTPLPLAEFAARAKGDTAIDDDDHDDGDAEAPDAAYRAILAEEANPAPLVEEQASEETAIEAMDDAFEDDAEPEVEIDVAEAADTPEMDADDDLDADDASINIAALDGAEELDPIATPEAASLSDEDEADLQRELAEVAAEAEETRAEGRHGRDILPDNDDQAMSRILDQADEELADPESSRRRNAIAQLKAAVAATEAARQLGEPDADSKSGERAYREDLDEVVRPRRAERREGDTARSERPRPAPLKLVASQRVDTDAAAAEAPSEPVRPRRVASATEDALESADNFAEFAAQMGARELPDLLEAAAAYTAFVEGNTDFSRPQIMQKVQATAEEPFSREDGLRSFGTLLRQGRINKVRNGRFQVTEDTRFRPEQRAS